MAPMVAPLEGTTSRTFCVPLSVPPAEEEVGLGAPDRLIAVGHSLRSVCSPRVDMIDSPVSSEIWLHVSEVYL